MFSGAEEAVTYIDTPGIELIDVRFWDLPGHHAGGRPPTAGPCLAASVA